MSDVAAPVAPSSPPSSTPNATPASAAPTAKAPVAPSAPTAKPSIADQVKKPAAPEAAEPQQTEAQKKEAERRKYKLKVDGADIEEELSDDEIAVRLQKARAADKRFQEAAEERKRVEKVLEFMKKDPWEAAKALGMDLEALAEQRLADKYKEQLLPEPEREKLRMQKELEKYKAQEQEAQKAQEAEARSRQDEQVYKQVEADFIEALKSSGLPQTKATIFEMAQLARLNLDHGLELTPQQMAAEAKARLEGTSKHFVSSLKGDALLNHLGPDVVKEVLKTKLAQVKAPTAQAKPPPAEPVEDEPSKPKQHMTSSQFRKKHLFGI